MILSVRCVLGTDRETPKPEIGVFQAEMDPAFADEVDEAEQAVTISEYIEEEEERELVSHFLHYSDLLCISFGC